MHMYDSLLAMDTEFRIYPWLATAWRLSEDQKSYIFTLRKDVKFHDGTPFNAEAVKFTFDRIPKPETKSTSAVAILGPFYETTEVLDEYTAAVRFKQPYAPFLGGVTTAFLGIVSPTAARKFAADFPLNPVGTGPYVFKEWVQKQSVTMVRNPDYQWPAEVFKNRGTGYLDEITYRFVPESATRQALLDTGEAQMIDTVPTQNVAGIRANPNQQMLVAMRTGGAKMVDLNCRKAPLDSLEVRQALNHAFNREELVRTLFQGVFQAAGAPLSPATFGYDKSVEGMYPYDPNKAAQLLDRAGWTMGSSGLREKGGQQFKLNCLIGTAEEDNAIAQIMQAQFKPLGIQIDINVIAGTALTTAKQQGQHDIGFKIAVYQDPDILGIYFHSRSIGGFNYTFYDDPQLNDLLDQGIAAMDAEKRKEIYARVQRYMMERAILIPVYYLANLSAASAKLQGLFHDTAGYYWLYDAWFKA
jgi:peptide/nickel transport system substrate-binding protein